MGKKKGGTPSKRPTPFAPIKTRCYGPYIQDSTGAKRELILDQDQCAGSGTNRTSKAMGRGVVKLYN